MITMGPHPGPERMKILEIELRCRCKADFAKHVTDMSECPIHPKPIERAAFLELAAVITDAGAEQLRRFLR